jgi:uncharacterized protein (DUF1501 family)
MSLNLSRRVFLREAGLAAVGIGMAPSSLLVRAALAASGSKVVVEVFLRGGADGLSLCVPHGESEYYALRQGIALPRPGQDGGVIDLDGYFGMHPELAPLEPLFRDRRLAFVHAVGNPQMTRSHFDAQDFMESGTPGNKQTATGWLDRAIAEVPGREVTQAACFSSQQVRSFLGPEPVLVVQNLAAFDLRARNWRSEAERLLTVMYQADSTRVGTTGLETFEAISRLIRDPAPPPSNGAQYPSGSAGNALQQAAALIKSGVGTRSIFVNVPGAFDTHSNQLVSNANDYRPLGQALAAFAADLGGLLDDVVVMVTTEFGRTAAVNGAAGTDHGTAFAMLVFGGSIKGGRVHGTWPGLGRGQLHDNRDLAVTTDFRDVFQEVARSQLGISASLFPGYSPGPGVGVI